MHCPFPLITDEHVVRIEDECHIPVDIDTPGTAWIVALSRASLLPTDEELRQLRSYQEFVIRSTYHGATVAQLLGMHLPQHERHHTVVFQKGLGLLGGWFWRRVLWDRDPHWQPPLLPIFTPLTLTDAIGRCESITTTHWPRWKAGHPDIFPPDPTIA